MFLFQNLHRCLLQQELFYRTSFTAHASITLSTLHLSRQQPVRLVCASASLHCLRAPYVNTSVSPPLVFVQMVEVELPWCRYVVRRAGLGPKEEELWLSTVWHYTFCIHQCWTHTHTHAILWARVRHSQAPKQTETVRLVTSDCFIVLHHFCIREAQLSRTQQKRSMTQRGKLNCSQRDDGRGCWVNW